MKDRDKSKNQLITELSRMRDRVDELETALSQMSNATEVVQEGREFLSATGQSLSYRNLCPGGRPVSFANQSLAKILGFSGVKELLGKDVIHFIDTDYRAAFEELISKQLEGGAPSFDGCLKLVKYDGTSVHVEVGLASITYHQHKATELLIRDITELKRVKERREELERLVAERTAELAKQNEQLIEAATEQARAGEALQEAEERFRAIFQS